MLIKKISPSCLSQIKKKYNLTHLMLWCKSDEGQYILSDGDNSDHKVQALLFANRFRKFLGWPNMSFEVPAKISELAVENKRLKEENARLKALLEGKNEHS